jgi:hypothetical protein
LFTKQDFVYDEVQDCYRCPAGEELTYRYQSFELNRQIRYYATPKCAGCQIKSKCTTNQRARRISRWIDEKLLEDMARRVRARPEMIRRRQQLSEPSFGTIKRAMGHGYFLMKGLNKVGAEMSLDGLELQHQTSYQPHRSQENDRSCDLNREQRSLSPHAHRLLPTESLRSLPNLLTPTRSGHQTNRVLVVLRCMIRSESARNAVTARWAKYKAKHARVVMHFQC